MYALKGVAKAVIVTGAAGLYLGDFSWMKSTHATPVGSRDVQVQDVQVQDEQHVNLPVWAGMVAIVVGAGVLLVPVRK